MQLIQMTWAKSRMWLALSLGLSMTFAVVGCGKSTQKSGASSEMSAVCSEYFSETEKMMVDYPQLADNFRQDLDKLKGQWGEMTSEEQENLEKICESGLKQIKQLKQP